MARRAAPTNPEMHLRGPRGKDMVTRADAPDTSKSIRGGGAEVEGKIRALEHADRTARSKRHEEEAVERARLRVTDFVRNTAGRRASEHRESASKTWVDEAAAHQRQKQEEAGRAHADWAAEEFHIDQMEAMHDHVAALYSATHSRLPGMDDTTSLR
ncbi:MAG: hypothetical protein AAB384_04305 [Patescibacteria group bacterium]